MKQNTLANGMPFINDPQVIGKWKNLGIIDSTDFSIKNINTTTSTNFEEIYFLPDGEKYWIFEGWTKGFLLIHYGGDEPILCYKYDLKIIENKPYLLIEIKKDLAVHYEVFTQVSDKAYTLSEIGNRDNINLPFIIDTQVIGSWISVGFVNRIEAFSDQTDYGELWLKSINFCEDGSAIRTYDDEIWHDLWTSGFLLDQKKSTTCAYEIIFINGKEYLFLEWKMGNYVFGGCKPDYYVFERKRKYGF